jgi:hypothetical protein
MDQGGVCALWLVAVLGETWQGIVEGEAMSEIDWRKVDALIAEHLFGYREIVTLESGYLVGLHPRQIEYGMTPHETIPFYSATWVGMGEVLEAMRRKGFRTSISFGQPWGEYRESWHGWFYRFEVGEQKQEGCHDADTAPRAVALAALKALGVSIDG